MSQCLFRDARARDLGASAAFTYWSTSRPVPTTDVGRWDGGDDLSVDTTPKAQVTTVRQGALQGPSPKSGAAAPAAPSGRRLGLLGAGALVVGSIVGVGIFNLPSALAPYGPITLVSMGLTTIGALALAWLFASLARRMPAPGGPYANARAAFGNGLGFANAWSYWITAWAGNAAIAVGWVLYVRCSSTRARPRSGRSSSCSPACGSRHSSI
jgi:hypothetical protein